MEKAIKIPIIASRINKVKENDETDVVILEICQLKERLENVKSRFNLEEDQDLIEACVYEMEAINARYRYLIRLAKERGISCSPIVNMVRNQ